MSEEKIYSQKEFDMWKESFIKEWPQHLDTAPKTNERLKALECKTEEKLNKKLFWQLSLTAVPIVIMAIAHLYVLYYGGIAELGKGIAVIETEVKHMKSDIAEIKSDIREATKP